MSILLTLFALSLFLIEGFLLIRILEGKSPVLSHVERLSYGFLIGCAVFSYATFWLVLMGLPMTFGSMLTAHALLLFVLGVTSMWRFRGRVALRYARALARATQGDTFLPSSSIPEPTSRWIRFLLAWCVVWTIVKIVIGGYDLLSTPAYFNDVYASWNMRAKVFFVEESLLLDRKPTDEYFFGGRVPSYPLTVHLSKVWIAKTVGNWNESAVNSIHFVWFLSLLGVFFSALKRELNMTWAIAGTAVLVSLPLVLVHGVNAYSDVLMAGFVFAALYAFYRWRDEGDVNARGSWLLLFSAMTAAMIFVKNEALLIFIPTLAFLFLYSCWKTPTTHSASSSWPRGNHQIPKKHQISNSKRFEFWILDFYWNLGFGIWSFLTWILVVSLVVVPWTLFKWFYGLTFGNATEVSGFSLEIHPGVAFAVEGDLLYTGSYLLFFPLFVLLLFMGFSFYFRKSLGALVLFFLTVFVGEFLIYLLTPLATEAIRHTGFGRGMVHILPIGVFVSMLIFSRLFAFESLSTKYHERD